MNGIDLDETGFPDKGLEVIADAFVVEVDAGPDVAFAVLDAQAVEDVGGVEAGVVAQLAGDDLEGFGEGFDDGLLFVRHVFVGVAVQEGGDFHLWIINLVCRTKWKGIWREHTSHAPPPATML